MINDCNSFWVTRWERMFNLCTSWWTFYTREWWSNIYSRAKRKMRWEFRMILVFGVWRVWRWKWLGWGRGRSQCLAIVFSTAVSPRFHGVHYENRRDEIVWKKQLSRRHYDCLKVRRFFATFPVWWSTFYFRRKIAHKRDTYGEVATLGIK